MDELAERVERATGPDRELDLRIAVAVLPDWDGLEEPAISFHTKYGGQPAYTASLDAAMTLVPEGWRWCVDDIGDGKPRAFVEDLSDFSEGAKSHDGIAATPALALCAAALRAHKEPAHG